MTLIPTIYQFQVQISESPNQVDNKWYFLPSLKAKTLCLWLHIWMEIVKVGNIIKSKTEILTLLSFRKNNPLNGGGNRNMILPSTIQNFGRAGGIKLVKVEHADLILSQICM